MTIAFHSHARTFGHGARPALAIHCTLAHSGAWRRLGQCLGDLLTITAVDLPGHGKSDNWNGGSDLHSLCTTAMRDHLIKPMDVIGHSFGATIALRLAVEHPHLVRSLTLIEPVFFAVARVDRPDLVRQHEAEIAPCFEALQCGETELAARLFNRVWGDGTKWDDIPEVTRRYMTDRMHIVLGQSPAVIEDNAGILAPGVLGKAVMPSLLIEGERSADVIKAIHDGLAARLPHVQRAVIAGAGHMSPITHPEAVAREIAGLLEMVEE